GRGPLGAHLIDTTWVRGFGGVCGALCQGSGSMSGPWRVRGGVLGPGMDVYLTSSLVVAYTHGDLEGGTSTVRQDQRRLQEQIGDGGGTDTIGRVRDHVHQCCTRDHDPAEEAVIAYPGMVVRTDATGEYGVSVGKCQSLVEQRFHDLRRDFLDRGVGGHPVALTPEGVVGNGDGGTLVVHAFQHQVCVGS